MAFIIRYFTGSIVPSTEPAKSQIQNEANKALISNELRTDMTDFITPYDPEVLEKASAPAQQFQQMSPRDSFICAVQAYHLFLTFQERQQAAQQRKMIDEDKRQEFLRRMFEVPIVQNDVVEQIVDSPVVEEQPVEPIKPAQAPARGWFAWIWR